MNATVLELADVHKDFEEPMGVLRVLRGVTVSIRRGEISMIMGPSGSGKTTLLQIAGCLIRPSRGQVEIMGSSLAEATEAERLQSRRTHLGFVFQNFHLVGALTVFDNVALGLRLRRQPVKRDCVHAMLDRLGIAAKARKLPRDLSGGEKQRTAIARGMVGMPDLLLADEPTSQLDSNSAESVCRLLRDAVDQYRPAVLLATHDPRIAEIADRTLTLDAGMVHE